ncbi:hypothetical protein TKK_0000331 [Trichogramma kaykai]
MSQKATIMQSIADASYICLTADIWSAPTRSFMGITAHWLDKYTLRRKSAALRCQRFAGKHTHDRIAEIIAAVQAQYKMRVGQVVATVTDNGSNFVKAYKVFGSSHVPDFLEDDNQNDDDDENLADQDETQEEPTEEDLFGVENECALTDAAEGSLEMSCESVPAAQLSCHYRCASHTLNLIATTDCYNIISKQAKLKRTHDSALMKCKLFWKSLKSVQKREVLTSLLGESVKQPNVTRWNSLYDALSQIYRLKKQIQSDQFYKIIKPKRRLKDNDFIHIEYYVAIMTPLSSMINVLQCEEDCYYGQLIPALITIEQRWIEQRHILDSKKQNMYREMINGLTQSLKSRFSDFFNIRDAGKIAAVAALTHLSFKSTWIKCLSKEAQVKIKNLKADESNEVALPPPQLENDFYFGTSREPSELDNIISVKTGTNTFLRYLSEPTTSNFSYLNNFPSVKQLFLKTNTILPSSAPVKRLFSYATILNLPKFNKLTDEQFERRILAKVNLQKLSRFNLLSSRKPNLLK